MIGHSLITMALSLSIGAVDFDTEIIPALTKAGCNGGACHGSAAGRGGFRLSLLGGDPAFDYDSIVRDQEGRRIRWTEPSESLVWLKPAGQMDHGGGVRLEEGSAGSDLLLRWIREGAKRTSSRRLTEFRVEPAHWVGAAGASVELKSIARFDDGSTADATSWTVFASDDPSAVAIDPSGRAQVRRAGRFTAIARYGSRVAPIVFSAPLSDRPLDLSRAQRVNFIDDQILKTLETLRIAPAPEAGDSSYLRRLRLDLTGRLPEPAEVRDYVNDRDPLKKRKLADRLLNSAEFADYWTQWLSTLLRVRFGNQGDQAGPSYHSWIRDRIRDGTGFDRIARSLLTTTGDSWTDGSANFHRVNEDGRAQAEFVADVFMGTRLQCANCHNHPLDRWTQDDYHGLAAILTGLDRGRMVKPSASGTIIHPRTGEPARMRLPGDRFLPDGATHEQARRALADWLTDPANPDPVFARSIVNRLWRRMMGRGLIDPVDDARVTNPASHPELLDALAQDFASHGYDLRRTLGLIAESAAYGRGWIENGDDRFYSRALIRPLPPEVLADAISDVAGVPEIYGDAPPGTRAVELADPATPSLSLDLLGRCSRQGPCGDGGGFGRDGGLAAKLHWINGDVLNAKIADPEGRLRKALIEGRSPSTILDELCEHALARRPDDRERQDWLKRIPENDRAPALEDWFWGLLNSREFRTNH